MSWLFAWLADVHRRRVLREWTPPPAVRERIEREEREMWLRRAHRLRATSEVLRVLMLVSIAVFLVGFVVEMVRGK